ncbi:MAG: dTDP-4-dehydrorhamnose reductase [Oscillospiraceae bacterium]|nr:dTDP-4-dehydrorhamnose reductase [Oscillospiraceae bacterium]
MNIIVTGATGQLGHDVCKVLTQRGIPHVGLGSKDCDITSREAVLAMFDKVQPTAVIHCAAYTKVDLAEDEPERCWAVNVDGTRNIAEACRIHNAKMLYISTDYVFPGDGEDHYLPDAPTGPKGNYGRTKLAGELAVQAMLTEYFIVRISWVFGINGTNFVKTMLKLSETRDTLTVVCDQIGSPTYTADLAPLLCDMIASDKYGVYHATNEGECSWADFSRAIFAAAGKTMTVKNVTTAEYGAKAARPANSRMSKNKLVEQGFSRLPTWQDALARYLKELSHE